MVRAETRHRMAASATGTGAELNSIAAADTVSMLSSVETLIEPFCPPL
jgi:hypothetical protein